MSGAVPAQPPAEEEEDDELDEEDYEDEDEVYEPAQLPTERDREQLVRFFRSMDAEPAPVLRVELPPAAALGMGAELALLSNAEQYSMKLRLERLHGGRTAHYLKFGEFRKVLCHVFRILTRRTGQKAHGLHPVALPRR